MMLVNKNDGMLNNKWNEQRGSIFIFKIYTYGRPKTLIKISFGYIKCRLWSVLTYLIACINIIYTKLPPPSDLWVYLV